MLNLDKHLPNKKLSSDGIWTEFYPKIKFKIAYAGQSNLEFKNESMRLALSEDFDASKINLKEMNKQDLEKLQDKNMVAYSNAIVKDWEGLEKDGEIFTFSKENCLWLFKNYPDVYQKVIKFSSEEKHFMVLSEQSKENIKKK